MFKVEEEGEPKSDEFSNKNGVFQQLQWFPTKLLCPTPSVASDEVVDMCPAMPVMVAPSTSAILWNTKGQGKVNSWTVQMSGLIQAGWAFLIFVHYVGEALSMGWVLYGHESVVIGLKSISLQGLSD